VILHTVGPWGSDAKAQAAQQQVLELDDMTAFDSARKSV
jgi:hypothetical protein